MIEIQVIIIAQQQIRKSHCKFYKQMPLLYNMYTATYV